MHVAFGRVRRKSRIFADYTDDADFKDFCLPSVLVRITGGMGIKGLRTQTGKFVVQKRRESEFPPTKSR